MPYTELLTDEAVEEIQTILDGDDFEAKYIAASIDNLTALCRTARYLLTENVKDYYFGDGLAYEDDLPRGITKGLYNQWFAQSCVVDGVRMGPSIERKSASFDSLIATVKQLRTALSNADRVVVEAVKVNGDLQSQLEQLRAENERLKQHVADLNHDLDAAVKECNEHHG